MKEPAKPADSVWQHGRLDGPKGALMLCLPDVDYKRYLSLDSPLPEVWCPSCETCLLRGHGWYRRYLGGELVSIRRTRCPRCRVTHALLPEDVCAYQDLTFSSLECAIDAGGGPTAAARAVGERGEAAVRRTRRWLGPVWKQIKPLLPAPGEIWDRIEAVVGPGPGKLIRLRRWLWSKLVLFLGGPVGLFRHGRPARATRRGST